MSSESLDKLSFSTREQSDESSISELSECISIDKNESSNISSSDLSPSIEARTKRYSYSPDTKPKIDLRGRRKTRMAPQPPSHAILRSRSFNNDSINRNKVITKQASTDSEEQISPYLDLTPKKTKKRSQSPFTGIKDKSRFKALKDALRSPRHIRKESKNERRESPIPFKIKQRKQGTTTPPRSISQGIIPNELELDSEFEVRRSYDLKDPESVKEQVNIKEMKLEVNENNISTIIGSSVDLSSNRIFILEGAVKITLNSTTVDRYLFLFNDILLITKEKANNKYKLKEKKKLEELYTATDIEGIPNSDSSIIIGWKNGSAIVTFVNNETMKTWLENLKVCINRAKAKSQLSVLTSSQSNVNEEYDQGTTREIFGQDLVDGVPEAIMDILQHLKDKGPFTAGIFRKSPAVRLCRDLKQKLKEGVYDLKKYDCLVIASVLKEYLRSVPGGLLPEEFMDVQAGESLNKIKEFLSELKPSHHLLLKNLITVLYNISNNQQYNNMNSSNLSICITPSCFSTITTNSHPIQLLIDHKQELFGLEHNLRKTSLTDQRHEVLLDDSPSFEEDDSIDPVRPPRFKKKYFSSEESYTDVRLTKDTPPQSPPSLNCSRDSLTSGSSRSCDDISMTSCRGSDVDSINLTTESITSLSVPFNIPLSSSVSRKMSSENKETSLSTSPSMSVSLYSSEENLDDHYSRNSTYSSKSYGSPPPRVVLRNLNEKVPSFKESNANCFQRPKRSNSLDSLAEIRPEKPNSRSADSCSTDRRRVTVLVRSKLPSPYVTNYTSMLNLSNTEKIKTSPDRQPPSYNEAVKRNRLFNELPLDISDQDTIKQKAASAKAKMLYQQSVKAYESTEVSKGSKKIDASHLPSYKDAITSKKQTINDYTQLESIQVPIIDKSESLLKTNQNLGNSVDRKQSFTTQSANESLPWSVSALKQMWDTKTTTQECNSSQKSPPPYNPPPQYNKDTLRNNRMSVSSHESESDYIQSSPIKNKYDSFSTYKSNKDFTDVSYV